MDRNLKIIALICRLLFRDLRERKKTFHFRSDFVRKRAESAFRQGIENRFARESAFNRQKLKRQRNKTLRTPNTRLCALGG